MKELELKEEKGQKSYIALHTSKNSGITLVALIITIIVLLILAVVSIRAVQGDGIIKHAKDAKTSTTVAQEKEQILLAVNEWNIQKNYQKNSGVTFKSFMTDKLTNAELVEGDDAGPLTVTMKDTGNVYTVKDDGTLLIGECWKDNGDGTFTKGKTTLKIGDYVDYKYDVVSAGYPLSKAHSGYSDQTITQPTTQLQWRVLGLDKNGNIELISATPATSTYVYFKGAAGYNNGVYLLNDMCEKLYSNSTLGIKARSLTIEDIEKQFSDAGKNARKNYTNSSSHIGYGGIKKYTDNKYPLIYAEETGSGVNGTIREGGIGKSVPFYKKNEDLTVAYDKDGNAVKTAYTTASGNLNTTQTQYEFSNIPSSYFKNETFHNMIFGTGTYYWLASRCVGCASGSAIFCLSYVDVDDLRGHDMFASFVNSSYYGAYLRPVVSLGSGVSVDTSTGNGESTSMYAIVKK